MGKRRTPSRSRRSTSAGEQLAVLRKLKQQAAAALVGWTPRGLRDANAPRSDDGTYDALALVAWRIAREAKPTSMSPAEQKLVEQRTERVRRERRENDMAEGRLVERALVRQEAIAIGVVLRMEAEAMERAFGVEIGKAIRSAFERVVQSIEERILKEQKSEGREAAAVPAVPGPGEIVVSKS